jgi:hypothetical protein
LAQCYSEESQVNRRVFGQQREPDLLDRLPLVRKGDYAAMGNFLESGFTTRVMAADTRIKVGVAFTGVSSQSRNIYRVIDKQVGARVAIDAIIKKPGLTLYDITHILAPWGPDLCW